MACGAAPTPAQKKRIATALADLEVAYVMRRRRRDARKIQTQLAKMFTRGRTPAKPRNKEFFWPHVLEHYAKQRDAEGLERAIDGARSAKLTRLVARYEARLAELRRES